MRANPSPAVALGLTLLMIGRGFSQGLGLPPQTPARTNVILVMADDQGYGDAGFRGHPVLRTPCIDELAKAAVRFDRFYAAAPVCSPTRGSCLTGRHPYRYGIVHANRGHLPTEEVTLAEVLREHGYRTGHFGKWHLGTLTKEVRDSNRGGRKHATHYAPPWEHGFDRCFSTEAKVPTYDPMVTPPAWAGDLGKKSPGSPFGTAYWNESGRKVTEPLEGDDSALIMERALSFIDASLAADQPFLAVIWFHAPHLPVVAGPADLATYATVESTRARHYYGCLTALDRQVGRLRQHLRRLDIADDTMLWYCSDNGPEGRKGKAPGRAAGLRGRKRSLYEGGVRVPAFLEWPGRLKRPRTVTAPCVTSDYFPTILAALGIEVGPLPLDGLDIMPLATGQQAMRSVGIGFESGAQATWVENRYKLVMKKSRVELYDLVTDPSESRDLSVAEPKLAARLAGTLRAWQESCKASAAGRDYRR